MKLPFCSDTTILTAKAISLLSVHITVLHRFFNMIFQMIDKLSGSVIDVIVIYDIHDTVLILRIWKTLVFIF